MGDKLKIWARRLWTKIEDLENILAEKSLVQSKNSLKDELDQAFVASCEKCGKIFKTSADLIDHINNKHSINTHRKNI